MPHKPGTGAIFGIVSEEGLVKDNSPVYLYDVRRDLGAGKSRLLAKRFTRSDGGFEFAGLDTSYTDYMLLATDEDGATPKNALIQDRVQPIDGHSGAGIPSEWYLQSLRNGAVAGVFGWPIPDDSFGIPQPRAFWARAYQTRAAGDTLFWAPMINPPTSIPNMNLWEYNFLGHGPVATGRRVDNDFSPSSAIEAIIDMDSIVSGQNTINIVFLYSDAVTSAPASNFTRASGYGFAGTYLKLRLNITEAKVLEVAVSNDPNKRTFRNASVVGTVDLSAYSGEIHLVASFTSGSSVKVFVNNSLESTISTALPGMLDWVNGLTYNTVVPAIYASSDDFGIVTDFSSKIAMLVGYSKSLSDQQVSDLYDALYVDNVISPVSGYARKLFEDEPHMYWRMFDFDATNKPNLVSEVAWADPNTGEGAPAARLEVNNSPGTVQTMIPAPIAGRNTIAVDAVNDNYFFTNVGGSWGWMFADRGSVSLWVKFDLATPAADETLVNFVKATTSSPDPTLGPYFILERTTGNRIKVGNLISGVLESNEFLNYTVNSADGWLNVVVTIDMTGNEDPSNGLIKLYVGDETNAPTLKDTLTVSKDELYTARLLESISAFENRRMPVYVMSGFTGSLCELAFFPDILTPARIEAHWTAKDIV